MSTQKGNTHRNRPQKHKNTKAFRNDLYDTSHLTKKLNNLEFYGLCHRCKDIIDWRVKFKKYKPLTTAKKCVKCLEKKVKHAYYIVCQDCCTTHKICSKCSKPSEELEFGESEVERRKKEEQFQQELKQLSERQRRKFLRLLEKGLLTKENLVENADQFKKENDLDDDHDDFDDEDIFDDDDLEESPKKKEKKVVISEPTSNKPNKSVGDDNDDDDDDDDDGNADEYDDEEDEDEEYDEEDYEDEDEEEK